MIEKEKEIDLLYIEDNEDFVDFVGIAVKKLSTPLNYHFVTDGAKAKQILEEEKPSIPIKKAKLILLDYNLPGVSGMQLLKHIRSFPEMKHTPVVIFSSSDNPNDVATAYANGANAYLVKPLGMSNLKETIQVVCDFWINKNQRPIQCA